MESIIITLTLEELMSLPGEAVIVLLDKAGASPELLAAAHAHERRPDHGKGRWIVCNHILTRLHAAKPTAPIQTTPCPP